MCVCSHGIRGWEVVFRWNQWDYKIMVCGKEINLYLTWEKSETRFDEI